MAPGTKPSLDDEWDVLTSALNRYGIRHVAPLVRRGGPAPRPENLFRRLALSGWVRLREAMVLLLISYPHFDLAAQHAIEQLPDDARYRAKLRYVAASALQRMWWTRLRMDLGPRRPITPAYIEELGLPSLDQDFGEATLLALSNQEEARYGHDAWVGYTSLMDLFLNQLAVDPDWGKVRARAG
jgi:hypothetical protein